MTKVVKSDLTHPAGFEQLRETLRYIVRLDQVADFIDAYIIQILAVVSFRQISPCRSSVCYL